MKAFRVFIAPEAKRHIDAITVWWRENRTKNPTLFEDEIEAAIARLASFPKVARPYREVGNREIRRLCLRGSNHYVYCVIYEDRELVQVVAVWHTSRGLGPSL